MKRLKSTRKIRKLFNYLPMKYMLDFYDDNSNWLPKTFGVYTDDTYTNSIVMICHNLFINSDCEKKFIEDFFMNIMDRKMIQELGVVFIFYDNKKDPVDTKSISKFKSFILPRRLYKFKEAKNVKINDVIKIKDAYDIKPKDLNIIDEEVKSTATYKDINDFLINGKGYTFIKENSIQGFCTTEYPSENALAFGIMVNDKYQKQGYAKSMASKLIKDIINENPNKEIYWDCDGRNVASYRTAMSCGFEKICEFNIIFLPLREKD